MDKSYKMALKVPLASWNNSCSSKVRVYEAFVLDLARSFANVRLNHPAASISTEIDTRNKTYLCRETSLVVHQPSSGLIEI